MLRGPLCSVLFPFLSYTFVYLQFGLNTWTFPCRGSERTKRGARARWDLAAISVNIRLSPFSPLPLTQSLWRIEPSYEFQRLSLPFVRGMNISEVTNSLSPQSSIEES